VFTAFRNSLLVLALVIGLGCATVSPDPNILSAEVLRSFVQLEYNGDPRYVLTLLWYDESTGLTVVMDVTVTKEEFMRFGELREICYTKRFGRPFSVCK
jgi:hypothetical protein